MDELISPAAEAAPQPSLEPPATCLQAGITFIRAGDFDQAIAEFGQAIALDPDCAEGYAGRGQAYAGCHEYANAIADYDQLIRLEPYEPRGYHLRARANAMLGDYARATADYTVVIGLQPGDADALTERGRAYLSRGDRKRAQDNFGEAARLRATGQAIVVSNGAQDAPPASSPQAVEQGMSLNYNEQDALHDAIQRETRSWAVGLLILGVVQIAASNFLDPGWGILLIVVAALSFYFRSLAMLPVYGVTLVWALISNLMGGKLIWSAFGLMQIYWSFRIFQKYWRLRRVAIRLSQAPATEQGAAATDLPSVVSPAGPGALGDILAPDRAAPVFPWAGCALSGLGMAGIVAFSIIAMIIYVITDQDPPFIKMAGMVFEACLYLSLLGLSFGLAALLTRYRFRGASVLAVIGGALLIAAILAMTFLGRSADAFGTPAHRIQPERPYLTQLPGGNWML
jgi:tetratricopeptide (TPR) repeat protein